LGRKKITNVLFSCCKFSFEGIERGEKKEVKDRSTGAKNFITFKDDQPQDFGYWDYLEVTASKL
jgi:hypothetical protein